MNIGLTVNPSVIAAISKNGGMNAALIFFFVLMGLALLFSVLFWIVDAKNDSKIFNIILRFFAM